MNTKTRLLSAAALTLMLAACGTDPQERTTGGAAAGAATGAGIGALGGPPGMLAGAAIGGGVGAVTGATTSPSDVNLGRPVWDNPETRVPGSREGRGRHMAHGMTRDAQQALSQRGYNPGPVDGVWGQQSRQATMSFQTANNIPATGRLDRPTREALNLSAATHSRAEPRHMRRNAARGQMGTQTNGSAPDMAAPQNSGSTTGAQPMGVTGTDGGGSGGTPRN